MYTRAPGIMLVVTVTAIIYLFLLHRVLDRMRMGKREALLVIAAMIVGGMLPAIPLGGGLAFNIGGAGIPAAVCIYLIIRADSAEERFRGPVTALVAAAFIWSLDRILPLSPGSRGYELDPLYIPAAAAGLIAYILGRSRRSAFIGGVLAVVLMDLASWAENMARGFRNIPVILGGAGVFDAAVIAGVIAVLLAELVGEARERVKGGPQESG